MIPPASGPFLFDTSAESWLGRSAETAAGEWFGRYLATHPIHISAITVLERVRGYAMLARNAEGERLASIEASRLEYLRIGRRIWPVDGAVAIVSAELLAVLPNPATPPRRGPRIVESRQERLVRWRFDVMIAATALVARMTLIHRNPADFEAIRSAIEIRPRRFPGLGPLELLRCESLT